ncbi:hypothetical protein [Spiroplasma sp. SV19]|uniref:oxidoreductase n=1 Tax=Spiroplasma sp. SV19 TaxID=2570468 RepID=UPI0024B743A6|nr:hypothetical protein [Spiroplasma sp. SV19]WHQ36601.1 hypothetical protein E7Y35_01495 [Spiroplasma sp. SV19]
MIIFSGFENGKYTLDELNYYQTRTKNLGIVIIGCSYFNRNGKVFISQPAIDNDKYIPNLAKLANIIHQQNSLVIMQIHHGGDNVQRPLYLINNHYLPVLLNHYAQNQLNHEQWPMKKSIQ